MTTHSNRYARLMTLPNLAATALVVALALSPLACGAFIVARVPSEAMQVVDKEGSHVKEAELTKPVEILGVALPTGTRLGFDERDDITWIRAPAPVRVGAVDCPAGARVKVKQRQPDFGKGRFELEEIKLAQPAEIGAIAFLAGDEVRFDAEGHPVSAVLAGARSYGSTAYPDGAEVRWNLRGEVTGMTTRQARERAAAERTAHETRCREHCAGREGQSWTVCYDQCQSGR